MTHKNDLVASGTELVVASASENKNYDGLLVLTASDITYKDSLGNTTTLTAVAAGITITCKIVKVTTCTGTVLGYLP